VVPLACDEPGREEATHPPGLGGCASVNGWVGFTMKRRGRIT
jgi:hypothetical protein